MGVINRKFKESPWTQGAHEQVPYRVLTTPWGSTPTSAVCRVMVQGGTNDTSLISTSTGTISGDYITTGYVKNLVEPATYELEIQFNISTSVFEAYGEIEVD